MLPNDFVSGGALLIVLGAVLAYFRELPSKLYSLIERWFIIKIDIQDEDESFQWVKLWLSESLKGTLSVSVFTQKSKSRDPDDIEYETDKRPNFIFTPSPGWYCFFYMGRFVTVYRSRTEPKGVESPKTKEAFDIKIFSRNLDIAKNMIEDARNHALPNDGKIEIRNSMTNYWSLTGRIAPRPIDSVILEGNTIEEILKDIRKFQASSEWYNHLGVPHRRGYLFHGPPGGGKTSLVLGIASALGMNVNVINLASPGLNDDRLVDLLSQVGSDTIVLIEDIDCAFVKRDTGQDRKGRLDVGLTFSGLLNALDGIVAQEGRIIFMTTNHPEKLDEALIRPGRADVKVYIGKATQDQIYRLFCRFHPDNEDIARVYAGSLPSNKLSMAEIQHHLMVHRDSPKTALDNIDELLKVKDHAKAA